MVNPYMPDASDWIGALEAGEMAGQRQRKTRAMTQAGGFMASGDYEGAARAMLPIDPATGLQIRNVGLQAQDRETKLQRQTQVQQLLTAGKIAEAYAAAGADDDLLNGIGKVVEHTTRIGEIQANLGYGLKQKKTPQERQQAILGAAPQLIAQGIPQDAIDRLAADPSDAKLDAMISAGLSIKDQVAMRKPSYEKLAPGETLAAVYPEGFAPPEEGPAAAPAPAPAPAQGQQTAAAPQGGGQGLPRGLRNNNPLNVRPLGGGQKWQGQTGADGGNYAQFGTEQDGWNAAHRNLATYGSKHGINTIAGVINRWAPANDRNDPAAYAATVAKKVGLDPNAPINLADAATREKLLTAMAEVELGRPYKPGQAGAAPAAAPGAAPQVGPQPGAQPRPGQALGPNVRVAAVGAAPLPAEAMTDEELKQWNLDPGTVAIKEQQKDGTIRPRILQRGKPSRQDPPASTGLTALGNGYYRDKVGRTFQPNATGGLSQVGSLTDQAVQKTVETVTAIGETASAVNEFKTAIADLKPTEFGPLGRYGGDPAKFARAQSAATNLMMLVKGPAFYNLGVLSGPDQSILEGIIANPSKWGTLVRQGQIIPAVNQLERGMMVKRDATLKGFQAMGGDPRGLDEVVAGSTGAAPAHPAAGAPVKGKTVPLPGGGSATVRVKG